MCDNCCKILIGFPVKHAPEACPLIASLHCSVCCTFGHSPKSCPTAIAARRACPITIRRAPPRPEPEGPVFTISSDPRTMRAFLYSQELPTAGKLPALKERLEEWAIMEGYVDIVFTP